MNKKITDLNFFLSQIISSQVEHQKQNLLLGIMTLPLTKSELHFRNSSPTIDNTSFIQQLLYELKLTFLHEEKQQLLSNLSLINQKRKHLKSIQTESLNPITSCSQIEITPLKIQNNFKTNVQIHNEENEFALQNEAKLFLKDIHSEKEHQLQLMRERKRKEQIQYMKTIEHSLKHIKREDNHPTYENNNRYNNTNSNSNNIQIKSKIKSKSIENNKHFIKQSSLFKPKHNGKIKLPPLLQHSFNNRKVFSDLYTKNNKHIIVRQTLNTIPIQT